MVRMDCGSACCGGGDGDGDGDDEEVAVVMPELSDHANGDCGSIGGRVIKDGEDDDVSDCCWWCCCCCC